MAHKLQCIIGCISTVFFIFLSDTNGDTVLNYFGLLHNKRFFNTVVLKFRQCCVFLSLYNSVFRHLNYLSPHDGLTTVYNIFLLVSQRSVLFLGPHGGGALIPSPRVRKMDRLLPATKYSDTVIYYPI